MFSIYLLSIIARLCKFSSFRYHEYTEENFISNAKKLDNINALYIHIPFCENLCDFCFFHKFPYNENNIKNYYIALLDEIAIIAKRSNNINSVYIGGGTPTIYLNGLINLLKTIRRCFNVKSISVESDPFHIGQEELNALKIAGVNRLSIGIQSFNESVLNKAGRANKKSFSEIKENLKNACNIFETVNIDLIFNFRKQHIDHINYDLECIRDILPHQITYYPIMEHNRNIVKDLLDKKKEKELYFYIINALNKDYHMNSVWSFASKKNIYDEYLVDNTEFLCAGCGSFGYFNGYLYANSFILNNYINLTYQGKLPIVAYKKLNSFERILYLLTIKLYSLKYKKEEFSHVLDKKSKKIYNFLITYLKKNKIITVDDEFIKLTHNGLYYWLNIMKYFYINVNTLREFCKVKNL
jgi:coproporphyrinogen III oxidase-like Fe-S oxidoreductase